MDLVLDVLDEQFLTRYVYPTSWGCDYMPRQILSLLLLSNVGGVLLYLVPATLSYVFVYDKKLMEHPQFLQNQVRREIVLSLRAIPQITVLAVPIMLAEVRGYSLLHSSPSLSNDNIIKLITSTVAFTFFVDTLSYWTHRLSHHKSVYRHIHKPHHVWKITTPFASHSVHPIDGFIHSLPLHIYPFLFPLDKILYLGMLLAINIWAVLIHDGGFRVPRTLRPLINGTAHHTGHHLYYNYNYGLYFTLWDRMAGSYKPPKLYEKDE